MLGHLAAGLITNLSDVENDGTALVSDFADQLRGMLDRIAFAVREADEETRLRIEGGVVALDAVVGMLGGVQTDEQEPATENYFDDSEDEDEPDGEA